MFYGAFDANVQLKSHFLMLSKGHSSSKGEAASLESMAAVLLGVPA